jgi:hypothetical protein
MKHRYFYLADNLDVVDRVKDILNRKGVKKWNFHVLSKDGAGVYKHHLHSANVLQTTDLWRHGERGAIIGFLLGVASALFIIGVMGFFRNYMLIASIVIIGMVTLHGAWIGGMAGVGKENYRIRRFHNDIESGRILLIIDINEADRRAIDNELEALPIRSCGGDRVLVMPFDAVQKT